MQKMNDSTNSNLHQSMLHQLFKTTCVNPRSGITNEASSMEFVETSPMMRMLLMGPSNSFQLRSSLSMDVAYTIASKEEDSFENGRTQNADSNATVSTILVPRHSHEIHSLLDFPFQCRPYSSTNMHLELKTNDTASRWNDDTLSKISIHQIDGIYQLIQTLATVHICNNDKKSDQPKILIVQDIHEYIREQQDHDKSGTLFDGNARPDQWESTPRNHVTDTNATYNKQLTTEELMKLNHLVALIADACCAFDETCHLLVTCDTSILPINENSHVKHMLFRHLTSIISLDEHDVYQQQNAQHRNVSPIPKPFPFKIISSWDVCMEYDSWQDLALQQRAVKKNDTDQNMLQRRCGKLHIVSNIDQVFHNHDVNTNSNCEYNIPELLDNGGFGDDEKEILWEIDETV